MGELDAGRHIDELAKRTRGGEESKTNGEVVAECGDENCEAGESGEWTYSADYDDRGESVSVSDSGRSEE